MHHYHCKLRWLNNFKTGIDPRYDIVVIFEAENERKVQETLKLSLDAHKADFAEFECKDDCKEVSCGRDEYDEAFHAPEPPVQRLCELCGEDLNHPSQQTKVHACNRVGAKDELRPKPIAYLESTSKAANGWSVYCVQCAMERRPNVGASRQTPFYAVNFGSYKQTCHRCGKVIAEGRTPAWTELFPAP